MAAEYFMGAPAAAPAAKQSAGAAMYESSNVMGFLPGDHNAPQWNTEEYDYTEENGWKAVSVSPFSTFAADVDTASYANLRRMILRGQKVPADAVRIEEMINYFSYDYPEPENGEPFSVTTEIAPCPWNEDTELLLVGLQAEKLDPQELPASNLVFLIDVSGSMDEWNKLPLVQRAFLLLAENLGEDDRISIVTYASSDKVVLDGVHGSEKAKITAAVEDLMAGGGTNGSAGIQTAYELAEKYFIEGGNNRVIMATDGDLNIGVTDQGSLTRLIEDEAKSGVYLSVLGFGEGNLADARMEALADHGNGNYSYIDDIAEARRVLTQEAGGTLFTVAKDVKLQVEFNPEKVKGYRLIGYENRVMAAEDFADDTKDGGELGAGHRVTALFEIAQPDSKQEVGEVARKYGATGSGTAADNSGTAAAGGSSEWCTVSIRYKEPDAAAVKNTAEQKETSGQESILLEYPVDNTSVKPVMSDDLSWAAGVAQVGMILKDSEYKGSSELSDVVERLAKTAHASDDSYRREFLYMIDRLNRAE
ncbi:MAG: VWA domain-containing protein [Stomatobaculum sp.]|nr:VWA domain-containing protein [Stomatobaculum sp.]